MTISLTNIDNALRDEDIESLIASGAPADEYSDEAATVHAALQNMNDNHLTEANVVAVLSLVWAKSFNRSVEEIKERLPAFQRIAARIL